MGSIIAVVRRFEPRTAGWEAKTLPLCHYAVKYIESDSPSRGGPIFGRSNLEPASLVEVIRLKRCFCAIGTDSHVS